MTIVHASFIVFDIPISPTFKEDNFLTESSWLVFYIAPGKYSQTFPDLASGYLFSIRTVVFHLILKI